MKGGHKGSLARSLRKTPDTTAWVIQNTRIPGCEGPKTPLEADIDLVKKKLARATTSVWTDLRVRRRGAHVAARSLLTETEHIRKITHASVSDGEPVMHSSLPNAWYLGPIHVSMYKSSVRPTQPLALRYHHRPSLASSPLTGTP